MPVEQEEPVLDPREYVWSRNLCHADYKIIDGKEVRKMGIRNKALVLMNRPMSTDKHIWKIKIGYGVGVDDFVGVCALIHHFSYDLKSK